MDMVKRVLRNRPRVLLVEDDAAVRRSLQLLLQARGFEVRSYACGKALLADETADSAACFIADYRMPGMDGLTILSLLRSRGWDKPAVLITAHQPTGLTEQAMQAGFSAVIEKPLRHPDLVQTIARLTNHQQERD